MRACMVLPKSQIKSRCQDMIGTDVASISIGERSQDVLLLERPELLDELNPGRYCSRSLLPESRPSQVERKAVRGIGAY
jgi:hypothetical protein